MLRFTTAGSVDDGKSTLIGRLLHDTKSVYEDQLAAVKKSRVNRAANGHVDFSLLTDGLKAEREQGITIDVAYRYFSTARRKFIIADTPGHEQYTRNMATGASTADVAIILIDAKAFAKAGGLLPQSRRHTYIASLLGIPHVVAAVNKMDLVDYSEAELRRHPPRLRRRSARSSDCPTSRSFRSARWRARTWSRPAPRCRGTHGPTLLEYLETVPLALAETTGPMRFPGAACAAARCELPRLRRPGRARHAARRRPRDGAALAPRDDCAPHRYLRRRPCRRVVSAERHRRAGGRDRPQPRRDAGRRRGRRRGASRGQQPLPRHGGLDARRPARASAAPTSPSTRRARCAPRCGRFAIAST